MRLLFETKDERRRFVNLALKENNPLCHEHLIPSHHTEDKYHSAPFMLLAGDFLGLSGPPVICDH